MKRLYYLFLLLLPLVYSCDPTSDSVEEETCSDGTPIDQLNCKVGFGDWRIKSVTSDVPRPYLTESTRDWAVFRPDCYSDSYLDLTGFAPTNAENEAVNFFEIEDNEPTCDNGNRSTIETDFDFKSAQVLIAEEHSQFFYGLPITEPGAEHETWYDIRFERDKYIRYRVDKTYEEVDYQVSVELVSAN